MFIEVNCTHCKKKFDLKVDDQLKDEFRDEFIKQAGTDHGYCPSCRNTAEDSRSYLYRRDSLAGDPPIGPLPPGSVVKVEDDAVSLQSKPLSGEEGIWNGMVFKQFMKESQILKLQDEASFKDVPLDKGTRLTTAKLQEVKNMMMTQQLEDFYLIPPPSAEDIASMVKGISEMGAKDPKDMDLAEYGNYLKGIKEKDLTGEQEWYGSMMHPQLKDEKFDPDDGKDLPDGDCDHDSLRHGADCRFCGWAPGIDDDEEDDEDTQDLPQVQTTEAWLRKRKESMTCPPSSPDLPRHTFSMQDLLRMVDNLKRSKGEYYNVPCKMPAQAERRLRLMADCPHENWQEFDFGHARKCHDCGYETVQGKLGDQIQIGLRKNLEEPTILSKQIQISGNELMKAASEHYNRHASELAQKEMDGAVIKGLTETPKKIYCDVKL